MRLIGYLTAHPLKPVAIEKKNIYRKTSNLRLERGGGPRIFPSCACFLIAQPFLTIYRHAIHQMNAECHGYLLVSMISYNSSEVKLKIMKEKEN